MIAAEALQAFLDNARQALAVGDVDEAERMAKAVSAMARAHRDVAELLTSSASGTSEEDAESIRADIRSRFRRLVEAEHAGAPADALERIAAEGVTE